MAMKTVEDYAAGLGDWRGEAVGRLRRIVLEAVPEAQERIKWAQPVFEQNGPFCYVKAFKGHVNFGFWRGALLKDPEGLIEGGGEKMGHVRIEGLGDIRPEAFRDLAREAARLNREIGDPTRNP